jgi:phosphate transport system permease protein
MTDTRHHGHHPDAVVVDDPYVDAATAGFAAPIALAEPAVYVDRADATPLRDIRDGDDENSLVAVAPVATQVKRIVVGTFEGNAFEKADDSSARAHHDDDEVPRPITSKTLDDRLAYWGSLSSSFAIMWVLYYQILPFSGRVGFVILWWIAFLLMYAGVSAIGHPWTEVKDRAAAAAVSSGAIVVFLALASAVVFTFLQGFDALAHLNFYTHDMAGVRPTDPLTKGGIVHAIVGTLIEIGIAVAVTLPLGIGTAVYMNEVGGRFSRVVRTLVEAMTALPSIVAGLFIYTTLIVGLGIPRTGFAAAMALSVMMLPIIARSADVVLRVMPGGLREASLALGASKWQTVRQVVLPTVRSGLATALILGIARGVGETSPVLLTSGASSFLNVNPFSEPMNSLPLFVFSSVRSGEPLYIARGFGAASVLMLLVLGLFIFTRFLARQKGGR